MFSGGLAMCREWRVIGLLRRSMEECAGSHSVGRPRRSLINTVEDCLKKRGLDVRQARRMLHDRSELQQCLRGNAWDVAQGMNP